MTIEQKILTFKANDLVFFNGSERSIRFGPFRTPDGQWSVYIDGLDPSVPLDLCVPIRTVKQACEHEVLQAIAESMDGTILKCEYCSTTWIARRNGIVRYREGQLPSWIEPKHPNDVEVKND